VLTRLCPTLASYMELVQDEAHVDPILLPSRLNPQEWQVYQMDRMTSLEMKLRLGHAFDLVLQARRALTVKSWVSRESWRATGGTTMTRSIASISRAEEKVQIIHKAYNANHHALVALQCTDLLMSHLRDMRESDVTMLSKWLEDELYKSKDRRECLPWIWTLAPLATGEDMQQDDGLAARFVEWNQEGILTFYQADVRWLKCILVIRLKWLHARAACERWEEEMVLLAAEMKRVLQSFEFVAAEWRWQATHPLQGQQPEKVTTGYQVYCMKTACMYDCLAVQAWGLQVVVGS